MENKRKFRPDPGLRLTEQVRQVLLYNQYAYRTEQTYCGWIHRYIKYFCSRMLYGSGLRLMECVRLRVHNLDFERTLLYVRTGKGGKDRATLFPQSIQAEMRNQIERVKRLHDEDLSQGFGEVHLPEALARKYPNAARKLLWQYVFLAKKRGLEPRSGLTRRHHLLESGLQKAVKIAVDRAGIIKRVGSHTFATPSPPTCSKTATISGSSRSLWAMPT